MERFVFAKPKVTKNNGLNLKKMRFKFSNAKGEVRESDAFDPIRET